MTRPLERHFPGMDRACDFENDHTEETMTDPVIVVLRIVAVAVGAFGALWTAISLLAGFIPLGFAIACLLAFGFVIAVIFGD